MTYNELRVFLNNVQHHPSMNTEIVFLDSCCHQRNIKTIEFNDGSIEVFNKNQLILMEL